ncbi:MAG: DUF2318 domain-containing protein [Spirochaetales bacterium]|nr:MAG: DUF2318 domain-containing protein [Spirochaetales bacterium]
MKKQWIIRLFILFSVLAAAVPAFSAPWAKADIVNGQITIPVDKVMDGKAHFYEYKFGKNTIYYFVLKSSDNVIRAAFNACDVCYQSKKGYRQDGDYMICNNCGSRFTSVSINIVKGGCNPSPLDRTISGNNVVINVSDMEKGIAYFR